MQFKSLALAALLSLGATSAFADTLVTASLQQPVAKPTRVMSSDLLWNCAGSTCQTLIAYERAQSDSICRDLAKQVGPVSAYGPEHKAFGAEDLAKCNAGHAGMVTASAR